METTRPKITVESDYDGYFESLVYEWCGMKSGPFNHDEIVVSAGPWKMAAVSFEEKGRVIYLDFYAALRNGFGMLSDHDIVQLIEIL
jgi:hypothetical protein